MAFCQRSMPAASGSSMFWKACSAVALPVSPDPVENAPRLGLLFGLVAQEGVLQGGSGIGRIEPHGLAELVARQRRLADLEIGVGQVLADVRALRRRLDSGEKRGHRDIVIARAQSGVRAIRRLEGRIARLGRRQHHRDGEKDGEPHTTLEILVRHPGRGSQGNLRSEVIGARLAGL